MKYIRTKDGIFQWKQMTTEQMMFYLNAHCIELGNETDGKIANTIEELCDEFVVEDDDDFAIYSNLKLARQTKGTCYGAIWTEKGLIYVAKMNEKGELCLL